MQVVLSRLIPLFSFVFLMVSCTQEKISDKQGLIIKGSDSELNLIRFFTDKYKGTHPESAFNVSGGGSKIGIEALMNNEADIANSSRLLTDDESMGFDAKGKKPFSLMIASDVVCVISNPNNGLDSISLPQLKDILAGKIHNWKELGGNDLPILIYGRDNNSGTRTYLQQLLELKEMSSHHANFETNKEIIAEVEKEKGAIGYVNVGSLLDKASKPFGKVWAMNLFGEGIPSCSPYENERVRAGEYLLTRPLIQYFTSTKKEIVDFVLFELEEEQQNDIELHGYLKINPIQTSINKGVIEQITNSHAEDVQQ